MSASIFVALALTLSIQAAIADNTGYATYSGGSGGVCSGVSSGLPVVSMNAAQFGNGDACGQCVQIQGTGNGAGQNPVSTAPYIAVINNVCPQCAPGDIDLQESGSGKFGITWSFTPCPGAGRRLIEGSRKLIVTEQTTTTQIRVSETVSAVDNLRQEEQRQEDVQQEPSAESAAPTYESNSEEQPQQTRQPVYTSPDQQAGQSTEASSQTVEEPALSAPAASFVKEGSVSRKILL